MAVEQYSVVSHDWVNLEFIINDLTQRVVGQELHPTSTPTFADLTLTGDLAITGDVDITGDLDVDGTVTLNDLTASRLVWTDGSKALASKDLVDLIAGTADEIDVADDAAGGVVIGLVDPLIVSKGGTGASSLTDHGILLGSGTSAVTVLGAATDGQLPIGSTGADPVLAEITQGTGVIITNGAGSIQIATNDTEIVHNNLSGLQGGSGSVPAERYHLNAAEHTELTAWIDDVTLSDGGAVDLGTGAITAANYTAANLLTACATNAGALDFSAASKTLTVEDNAIVSQDYSSDASPTFAGLTITGCATLGLNSAVFQPTADSTTFFQVLDADGGTSVFNIDSTNERIGIGVDSPSAKLHVDGGNVYLRRQDETTLALSAYCYSTSNKASTIYFYRSRGTVGSESAIQNGDVMGFFGFIGYGATGFSGSQAYFRARADGNWTDASQPTRFELATTPSGSTTAAVRLAVDSAGDFGIGESYPQTALEITHTTPYIHLHNSTHEDSDGGRESQIIARGEQSGGEETVLGILEFSHDGASDDEKGKLTLYLNDGDDSTSPSLTPLVADSSGIVYLGDGGTTNYAQFAADGELTLAGTARVIKHLVLPITAVSGASAPTARVTESPYLSWTFEVATTDDASFTTSVPHDMDYTADANIYVEWYTSADQTDDEVNWQLTWNAKADGEAVNAGSTTDTSGDQACPTQWYRKQTLVETIPGNSIASDDVLGLNLSRIAIVDGTNPTVGTIHVLALHIEYTSNKLGAAT